MRIKRNRIILSLLTVATFLVSCGTKQSVVSSTETTDITKQTLLQKVKDTAVGSDNITSKIEFTLKSGEKEISVSGALHMRKDDVIRIQLTPFGLMEAGRLEFTKDYVLILDRINKQYVKADYNQLEFLKSNNLDFYALQSLFWNELFLPGVQKMSISSLENYDVDIREMFSDIIYKKGKMRYRWTVDSKTGTINTLNVEYGGQESGQEYVNCDYSAFKAVGKKQFPSVISMRFASTAEGKVNNTGFSLRLKSIGTDSDWESRTEVGAKYKKVAVETLLNLLMNI